MFPISGWLDGSKTPFNDVVKEAPEFVCAAKPSPDADKVRLRLSRPSKFRI